MAWKWLALLAVAMGLGGCAGDSWVRVKSEAAPLMDAPRLPIAVYASPDTTTADIYLTDLSPDELDPGTDLSQLTGRILALHLFMVPLPGTTPMDTTACSVSIRHIVLARGSIGVYSGGGFLNPSREGGTDIGGDIRAATLRLTTRTPSFNDRLGPSTLDARFTASRDEALARRLKARVDEVLSATIAPAGNHEAPPKDAPGST
jgi:hypothetical protein